MNNNNMNNTLSDIMSSPDRIKILDYILSSDKDMSVTAIAYKTKVSKGLASKYLKILNSYGILSSQNRKYTLLQTKETRALKVLFILSKLDTEVFLSFPSVVSAGIYGSCARGENTESSDIDMWVKSKKTTQKDKINISLALKKMDSGINPIILDKETLESIKKTDSVFYSSLLFGSIVIYGGSVEQ